MQKIPVHIISGFLGAGKTTEILRLLGKKPDGENWAIIINEFGKISIDGQTLQAGSSEGSLFEISGGCICCSAQAYFAENLDKIIRQNRFSRILIEPSGLGGIDQILPLVGSYANLQQMPVVCIVDMAMTKIPRLKMLPLYRRQIEKADLILFSKTELVGEDELKELNNQFCNDFPGKDILSPNEMNDLFFVKIQFPGKDEFNTGFYPVTSPAKENYQEFYLRFDGNKALNLEKLIELFRKDPSIVRAKGYIYRGNEWLLFNFTMTGNSLEKCGQRTESELVIIIDQQKITDIPFLQQQIEALFY